MGQIYLGLMLVLAIFFLLGCPAPPDLPAFPGTAGVPPAHEIPNGDHIPQTNSQDNASQSSIEPLQAHYEPGEVTRRCDEAIKKTRAALDEIASRPQGQRGASLLDFENAMANFYIEMNPLFFTGYVYPDAEISAEGFACEGKMWDFDTETMTRKDIYNAILEYSPANDAERRLYDRTIAQFENKGLGLPDGKLSHVREMFQNLSALETKYSQNLNLDSKTIKFTDEELEGAPQDFLGRLDRTKEGKYIVTMKYPDYDAVMQNVKDSETRRKMGLAFSNRGSPEENIRLLEQAIALRQALASELGYATWFDYRTNMRMAKNAGNVGNFIMELKPALSQKSRDDIAMLLEFKKTLEPDAIGVDSWDIAYLENQLLKAKYSLDSEKVREYFPLEGVLDSMFTIYSVLFNVSFKELKYAKAWAPEVKLYRIADSISDETIGYIYFDLFPRNGKYGHEAMFPIKMSREIGGKRDPPIAVIIANKNPPGNGKPALLSHGEVVDLFHEFGHALHATLSRAPFASLAGTSVAWDFVETPSQTLENWPNDAEVITMLSGHYLDSSQKMPSEMVDAIIASQDVGKGILYATLLARSQIDMDYHTAQGSVDVLEISNSAHQNFTGIIPISGNSFPATFGHLMSGYDAGYYSYIWSQVYALDCFSKFQENGLFDQNTGIRFRKDILEQGDMKDGGELLRDFLGREPSPDALYRKLNVSVG